MAFQKRIRIQDADLLKTVRGLPCLACGSIPSDAHHVTSKGAGGDDVAENVMSLCRIHHGEWHRIGGARMAFKYAVVRNWLEAAGRSDIMDDASVKRSTPSPES